MNEQTTKKIFFNKSTLFNLKAELLKKQEEVQEKKQQPQHRIEFHRPPPAKPASSDDDLKTKKTFKDSLKAVDVEELEACRKAKLVLEKKAELYDHLSDDAGNSQLAEKFLVDFNTKKQQNVEAHKPPSTEVDDTIEPDDDDDDNEWTEFTDCLGRTRKCLKIDLEGYKAKDRELMKAINKDKSTPEAQGSPDIAEVQKTEKPLLVQKTNDYLQSLREKWEKKESELLAKDKDIHYQDLLFDEARMHGVAYYSFSTDDGERQKQMEELRRRREQTLRAQQAADELRRRRDAAMAARVAAARARQRARAGLPPDPDADAATAEPKKDFTTCLLEFLTKQKEEADAKAKENEKKIREEKEKERQKLRESYVREWDVGKEGVGGKEIKPFREMSQEEYVEQQRSKRIDEFAPPQTSTSSSSHYVFDNHGKIAGEGSSDELSTKKTWAQVRPKPKTPPPPQISDIFEPKGLYFTSSSKPASTMKYKNFVKSQEPIPIVNEINEDKPEKGNREQRKKEETSVEVPPPPTYDYYGPVPKRSKPEKPFDSDINEAYAQGAKSLQAKGTNIKLRSQYDFTFD